VALLLGAAGCPERMSDQDREYFMGVEGISPSPSGGTGGAALIDCDAPGAVFTKRDGDQVVGCAMQGCHDATNQQSGIDLSLADPFPVLVDKAADVSSLLSGCQSSGLLVIDSLRPEQSLLYTKMFRTDDPAQTLQFSGCGVPMPYPFGPSPAAAWERDCVLSWIRGRLSATPPDAGVVDPDAAVDGSSADSGVDAGP
jgi:hypothetical protein